MEQETKKRGGWTNSASAANGRKATGGGRPKQYITIPIEEAASIQDLLHVLQTITEQAIYDEEKETPIPETPMILAELRIRRERCRDLREKLY